MHAWPSLTSGTEPASFARERQQASVLRGGTPRRRGRLQPTSRFLGRPSVGGRLTAGAVRQRRQREHAAAQAEPYPWSSRAAPATSAHLSPGNHHLSCCLRIAGGQSVLCRSRNFEHTPSRAEHLLRRSSHEWHQCLQQQQPAHSSHSERRHLTPPSSGRAKGRFAPLAPPLMSNVRRLQAANSPTPAPLPLYESWLLA